MMGDDLTDAEWEEFEREWDEDVRLREAAKSPEQKAAEAAERERDRIYYDKCKAARKKFRKIRASDPKFVIYHTKGK